ncbi:MAG: putative baseplate assembly protein [Chloroflexi bacterium]|nr:putative baseplate assembly protein [Chloroflexota bacterium]
MSLEAPRLDDRSFNDLVEEALRRIPLYCPEWTDHNLSDPGITLIELFAWMTDIVLYRLNRVPDKHYVKFMELLGMRLREAEPARAPVTFWLTAPQPNTITLPSNIAISTTRTETEPAITFTTDVPVDIVVPRLTYVMTSQGGANQRRRFTMHDLAEVSVGFRDFAMFDSTPSPQAEDALYLGFDEDMSGHLLGLDIEVTTAKGTGIDPSNPPYVWEVIGSEKDQEWSRVEIDLDDTRSFNVSGLTRLHLPNMQRGVRNNYTAYWLRCRLLSPDEGGTIIEGSPMIRKIIPSAWGITVDATNVTAVRDEILGRSDGSPGQRFFLEHTPIVPRKAREHLVVHFDNKREERWTEVSDFASSGADDRHYTLDSMTGEVRLPPALPQRDGTVRRYGAIVPKDAMLVMRGYRYGGGRTGNVGTGAINVLKTAIPYVARVANRRPASGGLDAENLDDAKLRVPGHLRSLGRAVTASDFEYLAREAAPGQVGRAFCLQPPTTQPGEVQVLVIPQVPNLQGFIAPESLRLLPDVHQRITTYLDERRLLSVRMTIGEPEYLWVQTEVRFRPSHNTDSEAVRRAVETRLYSFLNPLIGGSDGKGWTFGRSLFVADVMAVLLAVPGVDFVRAVKLFPVTYDGSEFMRGGEASEIAVPPNGVILSFEHLVRAE